MEIIIMMMKGIIIILLFYMQPSLRQKTYCIDIGVVQKTSKQASFWKGNYSEKLRNKQK